MLYDKRWDRPLPDLVFGDISLRALIAWLKTMPPDGRYLFGNPDGCAAAQFLHARGFRDKECRVDFGASWRPVKRDRKWLYEIVGIGENTFGAALERALDKLHGLAA